MMNIDARSRGITEIIARVAAVRERKARLAELAARREARDAAARRDAVAAAHEAAESVVLREGQTIPAALLQTALAARTTWRHEVGQLDQRLASAEANRSRQTDLHRTLARDHMGATRRAEAVREAYLATETRRVNKALEDVASANRLAKASAS